MTTATSFKALLLVWSDTLARFGLALLLLPVAVTTLSELELSIWLLFTALLNLSLLADSGVSPTLLRAVAYFQAGAARLPREFVPGQSGGVAAAPNWSGIRAVLTTSVRLYQLIGVGAAVLLLTLGLASIWNVMTIAGHSPNLWLAFVFLLAWSYAQLQVGRWSAIFQGLGQVARSKLVDLVFNLIKLSATLGVFWWGGGVASATLVGAVVTVAHGLALRRAVCVYVPGDYRTQPFDRPLFASMWPATWRLGAINWGAFLITQGGVLVVAQLSDARLMASYLLTLRVLGVLLQISQSALIVYRPEVVTALACNRAQRIRTLTVQVVAVAMLAYLAGFVLLIVAGDHVLAVIGSRSDLLPRPLLLLLGLTYLLELHHTIHAGVYVSTNHVPFLYPAIVSGALIVGIGFLVIRPFGVLGLVILQMVVQALCNNWLPVWLSLRITQWPFREYLRSLAKACLGMRQTQEGQTVVSPR